MPDVNAPRRAADQLGQWAAHLSRSALESWGPYLLSGEICAFCSENALSDCVVCNDPVCLAHSHASFRGELICDECVERAQGKSKKRTKTQQAFDYFHLSSTATMDEVTAIYRQRSKSAHPDQGGLGTSMTELNTHYFVLKQHFERKAA